MDEENVDNSDPDAVKPPNDYSPCLNPWVCSIAQTATEEKIIHSKKFHFHFSHFLCLSIRLKQNENRTFFMCASIRNISLFT